MERPADVKARLLEAGLRLFRDGGLTAVTTRAVAAAAGVNEVTLFRHFGSKEGLLQAMVDRVLARLNVGAAGVAADHLPLAEDLERWATAYLQNVLPIARVLLLGLLESTQQASVASWHLQFPERLPVPLTRHLEDLQAAGRVRNGPLMPVAAAFYATLFAHALTAHLRPELSASEVARRTAGVFAAALDPKGGRQDQREDMPAASDHGR